MRWLLTVAFCCFASVAAAQGAVNIAWDAPPAGPVVSGYTVQVGTSPGTTASSTDVGNTTNTRLTFMNPGRFYVRVVAYNDLCCSDPSNELMIDIAAPPPPVDPCVATPLTVTVQAWPTNKNAARYTASHPIQTVTWLTARNNRITGANFIDIRGCAITVTK
jgi:hypothetical protein